MNIDFYFDVWPGMDVRYIAASTVPGEKINPSWIRYKISVNIPDPNKPDVVLVGEAEEVTSEEFAKPR